jgi:ketosteroid isomerase-like protein
MKYAYLPVMAFVILAGCGPAPAPVADQRAEALNAVRAAEEAAIRAFGERNAEKSAAFYAPDAVMMMTNMKVVKGGEIPGVLKELMADPNFTMAFETGKVEAAKSGELGYTRGAYTMTVTDPQTKKAVKEVGKYLTVYAKQADGSWKIVEDINNPDGPATAVNAKK